MKVYPSRVWDMAREYGLTRGCSAREILTLIEDAYESVYCHRDPPDAFVVATLNKMLEMDAEARNL